MSLGWGGLPLLPLQCVLDHLSTEDAMSAMTACRHWRNAILLYEGRKDTLKLRAKDLQKNLFLTRLFRKYTKRLHVYVNCNEEELEKFMSYVLTQYYDTLTLQELVFIGPNYIQQNQHVPVSRLKRIITESLVFKHSHCLQKFALLGCAMGVATGDKERCTHKNVEYYSSPLSFSNTQCAANSVLSSCNTGLMLYSTLKHIIFDHDQIKTESLESLSHLTQFSHLTLNVCNRARQRFTIIDWSRLKGCYGERLEVSVNIIALPLKKFDNVIENILVEDLPLVSFKVLFCKTLNSELIMHIAQHYRASLREFVWADSPYTSIDPNDRFIHPYSQTNMEMCYVNPFVFLCWQCLHLRRLALHGYWVWIYDLIGIMRLRHTIVQLEIPAIYSKTDRFTSVEVSAEKAMRVLCSDVPCYIDSRQVEQVNETSEYKWKPISWSTLHPALRSRPTLDQKTDYILQETLHPLDFT